jgi:hydrophobic/amphiphilic exporter-1 (mainly G- bacteria), HAE1 family
VSKFFINRPIVAIVIAIITVIVGAVTLVSLPIAQFPKIVPPEARITTTYVGADAQTVEQSVATPIEQVLSGVDNLNYMYSINGSDGSLRLTANFDVATDPNTDLILTQMRVIQAGPQLPARRRELRRHGAEAAHGPAHAGRALLADRLLRQHLPRELRLHQHQRPADPGPGIASATVFGAGQYAMRYWVKPDQLAKLNITVNDVIQAVQSQNTVNPAGRSAPSRPRRGRTSPTRSGPGAADLAGGVRGDRHPRQSGRLDRAPAGTWPGSSSGPRSTT